MVSLLSLQRCYRSGMASTERQIRAAHDTGSRAREGLVPRETVTRKHP